MVVSLIVAVAENGVIGKDNDLIWSLPKDMKHFRESTSGKLIITGRKNFESIPEKFRPLPNRINYVLSRKSDYKAEGCFVFGNLEQALESARKTGLEEVFIIGGGQIYKEALEKNLVDRLYYTRVQESFDGDTFFPELDWKNWSLTSFQEHPIDEKHAYPFQICIFQRKN